MHHFWTWFSLMAWSFGIGLVVSGFLYGLFNHKSGTLFTKKFLWMAIVLELFSLCVYALFAMLSLGVERSENTNELLGVMYTLISVVVHWVFFFLAHRYVRAEHYSTNAPLVNHL